LCATCLSFALCVFVWLMLEIWITSGSRHLLVQPSRIYKAIGSGVLRWLRTTSYSRTLSSLFNLVRPRMSISIFLAQSRLLSSIVLRVHSSSFQCTRSLSTSSWVTRFFIVRLSFVCLLFLFFDFIFHSSLHPLLVTSHSTDSSLHFASNSITFRQYLPLSESFLLFSCISDFPNLHSVSRSFFFIFAQFHSLFSLSLSLSLSFFCGFA
jgi:hypothetical protein